MICRDCEHFDKCVMQPMDCAIFMADKKPKKQTNEEWLRTCTTEELAEFIRQQRDDWSDGWYSDHHRFDEILSWLKEKHTDDH